MGKITRVRTGCWTCKKRHRKCDEAKPFCNNCLKTNRNCEGYGIRLCFDVDDKRYAGRLDKNGYMKHSFIGRPRTKYEESQVSYSKSASKTNNSATAKSSSTEILDVNNTSIKYHVSLSNKEDNMLDKSKPFPILGLKPSGNNLEQFSTEIFEGLEYFLSTSNSRSKNIENNVAHNTKQHFAVTDVRNETPNFTSDDSTPVKSSDSDGTKINELHMSLDNEIIDLLDKSNIYPSSKNDVSMSIASTTTNNKSLFTLSYQEENMMLKHFFKKLLPLLDAHPNSPWPDLALQYCDFGIARSCFISLACIHIYESRKGGNEYYRKGMAHINATMDYLIQYISSNNNDISQNSATADNISIKKKQISSFVILVLVNVHVLFTVLEKGKSSFSRFFLKVFASICQDTYFYNALMENEKKRSLVVVLSWYDTVSAIVSPDCRLPYCSPTWYGTSTDSISTSKMMGCPGAIFKAMSKVCFLRHELKKGIIHEEPWLLKEYEEIKTELFNYREYVLLEDGEDDYALRLKCAQCWSLAVYVSLNRTVKLGKWQLIIRKSVNEFIDVYGSMDSMSPEVTQMVWPVYAIGSECKTAYEKEKLSLFMEKLYETAQMGTLYSLKTIVHKVWESGLTQEEVLEKWLDQGSDYLPL